MFDDFHGTLQAALLLFMLVSVGGGLIAFRTPPDRERVLRGLGLSLLLVIAFVLMGMYYSGLGWPWGQLIVALACVWAVVFIGTQRISQLASLFVLLVSLAVFLWYAMLVRNHYVGSSAWLGPQQVTLDRSLERYRAALLERGEVDSTTYRAGWLESSDLYETYRPLIGATTCTGHVERAQRLWHSWLTRLYARIGIPRAAYYPGGRIPEGAPGLEWRDAP